MGQAGLQEIFSSIQGEGVYVGQRQIFVRFNACHLHCQYCDAPQRPAHEPCRVESNSGEGQDVLLNNPVSAELLIQWIKQLHQQYKHHSISFTGGEPLLYTFYLKEILPPIQSLLPVYLETSGTQPDLYVEIEPWVDIIAMDIKLPSATGEACRIEAHQAFYALAREKECFIKLVVAETTSTDELDWVKQIVPDRDCPIIIQPVTDLKTGANTVSAKALFYMEQHLRQTYQDVRVIPQTHKMLSLL
jgi:7-carboxy-7-deazaguanine synthase